MQDIRSVLLLLVTVTTLALGSASWLRCNTLFAYETSGNSACTANSPTGASVQLTLSGPCIIRTQC